MARSLDTLGSSPPRCCSHGSRPDPPSPALFTGLTLLSVPVPCLRCHLLVSCSSSFHPKLVSPVSYRRRRLTPFKADTLGMRLPGPSAWFLSPAHPGSHSEGSTPICRLNESASAGKGQTSRGEGTEHSSQGHGSADHRTQALRLGLTRGHAAGRGRGGDDT